MGHSRLTLEQFEAVCSMVAAQLRIKESDRWGETITKLKFVSFSSEFPEVSTQQLLWSAEQWIQQTAGKDFLRYPTWRELLSPLYRCEGGLANRSWGFREELPNHLLPTAAQKALLPSRSRSTLGAPDPVNADAYRLVGAAAQSQKLLPATEPQQFVARRLTVAEYEDYLRQREVAT
jgi:hypothetical protein